MFITDAGKLGSNLDWTSANAVKVEHHLGNLFDDSDEDELQTVSNVEYNITCNRCAYLWRPFNLRPQVMLIIVPTAS